MTPAWVHLRVHRPMKSDHLQAMALPRAQRDHPHGVGENPLGGRVHGAPDAPRARGVRGLVRAPDYEHATPGTRWATVPGDLFAVPREHVGAVLLAEALEASLIERISKLIPSEPKGLELAL